VVSRGKDWVFTQMLKDLAQFLDVPFDTTPALSPQALIDKLDMIMEAARRFISQIPEEQLDMNMRDRDRPIRNLCYHIFRLEEVFVDVVENGVYLTRELLNQPPPPEIRTTADLVAYGERVQRRLHEWWDGFEDKACAGEVDSYYGRQPLHNVLERHTWHPGQHVRQLMLLLEDNGITPDRPLRDEDFAGLPMPEKAWD
jgi:hypothetical protein